MNLHGIVSGAIGTVNPFVPIGVLRSTGSVTLPSGKRVPQYASLATISAQIQALSAGDIRQIEGLNIQGVKRAVYVNGRYDSIIRPDSKGGDLVITQSGETWLNVHVLEYWPDWCKFVITLQNPTIVTSSQRPLNFSNLSSITVNVAIGETP